MDPTWVALDSAGGRGKGKDVALPSHREGKEVGKVCYCAGCSCAGLTGLGNLTLGSTCDGMGRRRSYWSLGWVGRPAHSGHQEDEAWAGRNTVIRNAHMSVVIASCVG
ncbi:hypothetical protein OBBRIDRAFT_794640 [Obba rivulosa]|uniref:Uncharacterized protein n=1 Tax=Obba rivulosa TaxID=1052685 RepID=A0A8E2AVV4_9APHY|nr:hypothetical protein OBBRIDRAFT_794640 [Obba rivulosa]